MNHKAMMQLVKGIYLSPMVRGSELAFRVLAREYGNASLCYSPMLRDHDVISVATNPNKYVMSKEVIKIDNAGRVDSIEETAYLLLHDVHPTDDTENLVVQLCGSCPDKLAQATLAVLDIYSTNNGRMLPFGIDLNLGCPQDCAQKQGFGAFLVENNSDVAIACISAMRNAIDSYDYSSNNTNKPMLSAKIRLQDSVGATIEFVQKLQLAGCNFIAIHCRNRKVKHDGDADWDAGGKIVAAFSDFPIILNGGILDNNTALQVMEQTKCHAVMVATGYLRNYRRFGTTSNSVHDVATLALEYLEMADKYPPPSYLYIQKHLRWIFRDILQPENDPSFDNSDYSDWRVKLW